MSENKEFVPSARTEVFTRPELYRFVHDIVCCPAFRDFSKVASMSDMGEAMTTFMEMCKSWMKCTDFPEEVFATQNITNFLLRVSRIPDLPDDYNPEPLEIVFPYTLASPQLSAAMIKKMTWLHRCGLDDEMSLTKGLWVTDFRDDFTPVYGEVMINCPMVDVVPADEHFFALASSLLIDRESMCPYTMDRLMRRAIEFFEATGKRALFHRLFELFAQNQWTHVDAMPDVIKGFEDKNLWLAALETGRWGQMRWFNKWAVEYPLASKTNCAAAYSRLLKDGHVTGDLPGYERVMLETAFPQELINLERNTRADEVIKFGRCLESEYGIDCLVYVKIHEVERILLKMRRWAIVFKNVDSLPIGYRSDTLIGATDIESGLRLTMDEITGRFLADLPIFLDVTRIDVVERTADGLWMRMDSFRNIPSMPLANAFAMFRMVPLISQVEKSAAYTFDPNEMVKAHFPPGSRLAPKFPPRPVFMDDFEAVYPCIKKVWVIPTKDLKLGFHSSKLMGMGAKLHLMGYWDEE